MGKEKENIKKEITWRYLTYLFNKKDFIIYDTIKMIKYDDIALYSITPHFYAEKITRIIKKNIGKTRTKDLVLSDFCACIGGNSFNFIKYFKRVNCVELDKKRFEYLKYNLKLYKDYHNYKLYNEDCLRTVKNIKQDIIFIDPPWNGKDYKNKDKIDLFLGNKNSFELCNYFMKYCNMLVFKIPNNFDMEKLSKLDYDIIEYELKLFKLLIITKINN